MHLITYNQIYKLKKTFYNFLKRKINFYIVSKMPMHLKNMIYNIDYCSRLIYLIVYKQMYNSVIVFIRWKNVWIF